MTSIVFFFNMYGESFPLCAACADKQCSAQCHAGGMLLVAAKRGYSVF